eukprot:8385413-Alexandrium_andersonii.AAC.1
MCCSCEPSQNVRSCFLQAPSWLEQLPARAVGAAATADPRIVPPARSAGGAIRWGPGGGS